MKSAVSLSKIFGVDIDFLLLVNRADNDDIKANNKSEVKNGISSVNISSFITSNNQKLAV